MGYFSPFKTCVLLWIGFRSFPVRKNAFIRDSLTSETNSSPTNLSQYWDIRTLFVPITNGVNKKKNGRILCLLSKAVGYAVPVPNARVILPCWLSSKCAWSDFKEPPEMWGKLRKLWIGYNPKSLRKYLGVICGVPTLLRAAIILPAAKALPGNIFRGFIWGVDIRCSMGNTHRHIRQTLHM